MTLVKTLTATSSKEHDPIMDCCASKIHQKYFKKTLLVISCIFLSKRTWKTTQIYLHSHTIEDIVSRMHLAQLCHIFDRMTTGRGGADAGLTGDPSSFQS